MSMKIKMHHSFIGALALAAFASCASTSAGESNGGAAASPAGATAAKPTTVEEQFALGQKAYGTYCASCHGPAGQGTENAPAVVGVATGALPLDPPAKAKYRKTQFHTAMDVAQFVVTNMPPANKPKPSVDEYWAILAFDLTANGVKPTQIVGPDNAASYVIHP
jgi:mono/diheme cytochrome c family protein